MSTDQNAAEITFKTRNIASETWNRYMYMPEVSMNTRGNIWNDVKVGLMAETMWLVQRVENEEMYGFWRAPIWNKSEKIMPKYPKHKVDPLVASTMT